MGKQRIFDWGIDAPPPRLTFAEYECKLVRVPGRRLREANAYRRKLTEFDSPSRALRVRDSETSATTLKLTTVDLLGEYCAERFGHLAVESLWVVAFGGTLEPVALVQVAQGNANSLAVLPVDVLRPVLVSGRTQFVLVHNHPSGNSKPSKPDLDMTLSLRMLAAPLGLELVDHLVVGRHNWSSIRREHPRHWND